MVKKTKTKLATIEEVRRAAIIIFGRPDEESADSLGFSERNSAGDDKPPSWLVQGMQAKSKKLRDQFPNVFIETETVDEWFHVTAYVKNKVRIDRPEWDHKKVLAFLEKTVAPELQPFYRKVRPEMKQVDNGYPRILALYGQKWNEFSELSFHLSGSASEGWVVCARFGMVSITHKVTTSRGLLQTAWKKLKAEIGDLSNLNKVNKQGTW